MQLPFVLLPLFVEVLLTFGLLLWMMPLRKADFARGVARPDNVSLREPNWSPRTLQVAYCFSNQFELPVLFYVLMILLIVTRHADILMVVLAWIFVLARFGHAFVYTTNNRIMVRGAIFGIGVVVLLIMWVIFMVRIMLGLP